eukprot:TRINITY_DN19703_c0_g1_i4.p1 TRINITY_DN19703_c0_g1~~TRINITY_DN19703_c0_g1_i4.p1  ORF type:complete len:325 (+),score=80.35 TRINITY_DN19703_c0_g1_i4:78-977(+)
MLRSLVGSEMCIRDRYQRRVRGVQFGGSMEWRSVRDVADATFTVHRLSPLYHFQTSPAALRSYGQDIVNAITYNGQVPDSEYASASLHQLDETGEGCAISITFTAPGRPVPQYGVIYGDGRHGSTEHFAALPLLLTKGPADVWQSVLQWLQARFDCYVSPLRIPPFKLVNAALEWVSIGGSKPLELHYHLSRPDVPGIKNVTVTFAADAILRLQNSIVANAAHGSSKEARDAQLLKALESHFESHFHFNLAEAQLVRFGCGAAMLSSEGKLKVHDSGSCLKVLSHVAALSSLSMQNEAP